MDRCPQCSFATLDAQQACVACGAALQMTPIRVDGRPMPSRAVTPSAVTSLLSRITTVELLLLVVLGLLVASLSVSVLT
ncbi:hypothetical protein BH10ACT3_BH10ACT3_02720 [soil metagenome]